MARVATSTRDGPGHFSWVTATPPAVAQENERLGGGAGWVKWDEEPTVLTARAGARDNLAALAALDLIQPGHVLVIAAQGFTGTAVLGDNMARIAKLRGAVAAVTEIDSFHRLRRFRPAVHCAAPPALHCG